MTPSTTRTQYLLKGCTWLAPPEISTFLDAFKNENINIQRLLMLREHDLERGVCFEIELQFVLPSAGHPFLQSLKHRTQGQDWRIHSLEAL